MHLDSHIDALNNEWFPSSPKHEEEAFLYSYLVKIIISSVRSRISRLLTTIEEEWAAV